MDRIALELLKHFPSLIWFAFAIIALLVFRKPVGDLLTKIGGVKAMGVELSFLEGFIDEVNVELAKKYAQSAVRVSATDKRRVLNRVKKHLDILENADILWVDDNPENNINERRMFRQLKVEIEIARSSEEALKILSNGRYDLVFSDMDRDGESDAGIKFLKQFREIDNTTPVVFYIDKLDPAKGTPAGAFGITNRPDELLHLTLDALERRKYEKA
ncbi:response regulator [Candidatus Poribacteria bacterium]